MPDIVEQDAARLHPRVFIGVDPGVGGGVAVITTGTVLVPASACEVVELPPLQFWRMPDTQQELWRQLSRYRNIPAFACLEMVGGWVGGHGRKEDDDGTTSNPGSAMFTFGESFGACGMALVAAGIQHELVRPQAWQKFMGCGTRPAGMKTHKWKGMLKERAQELFPVKVTKAVADALLIAEYCKRKWGAA